MKKSFPGYYRPSEDEFSELWKTCLFVLDANVLLNLYRYSPETSEELMGILNEISDRLWVPHQAASEYHKNRLEVIEEQAAAYNKIVKRLERTQGRLETEMRSWAGQRRHPFIKADDLLERIGHVFTEVKKKLKELEEAHPDLFDEDPIREALTDLLETKVGSAYSSERMREICKEGERRYPEKIPPGYRNAHKEGTRRYGDLILWFQVIDKAKETKKPIILVTDDVKEDWWLQFKGGTIGPRPELGNEMASEAGVSFWMYPAHRFMEEAREYLEREVKQEAIDEVQEVRRRYEEYIKSAQAEAVRRLSEDALRAMAAERRALSEEAEDQAAAYRRSLEGLYKRLELPTSRLDEMMRAIAEAAADQDAAYRRSLEGLYKRLELPTSRLDEMMRAIAEAAADQDAAYRRSLERFYKDLGMAPPPTGRETTEDSVEGGDISLDSEPEEEPDE